MSDPDYDSKLRDIPYDFRIDKEAVKRRARFLINKHGFVKALELAVKGTENAPFHKKRTALLIVKHIQDLMRDNSTWAVADLIHCVENKDE